MTSLYVHPNMYSPEGCERVEIEAGQTYADYLNQLLPLRNPEKDKDFVALLNGVDFPQEAWGTRVLRDRDVLRVSPRPKGFEVIALAAVAAMGAYVYTNMQQPPAASHRNFRESPEASPTYDGTAQGNTARLNHPVPDGYGLERIYFDFASNPWRRFENGERYIYCLLSVGLGHYQISEPRVGNTPFSNFEDIDHRLYAPGEKIDLFPTDVYTVGDVSNLDLPAPNDPQHSSWTPAYVGVEPGKTITGVEVDIVTRSGLQRQDEETGDFYAVSVTVALEAREIDDAGNALGGWVRLGDYTLSDNTANQVRKTFIASQSPGRYEYRMVRTSNSHDPDSNYVQDDVVWGELRVHLDTDQTFDHSVWAVKMRVTDQVASQSENKISAMRQRLLRTWSAESGWSDLVPTRNLVWAYCNIVKTARGGIYNDDYLDLETLKQYADLYDQRGDYFDYNFETRGTLWAALETVCRVGRAKPVTHFGVYSLVRDEPKTAEYPIGMRQQLPGSLSVKFKSPKAHSFDCISAEYKDQDTGEWTPVLCVVPGRTASRPKTIRYEGITTRDHVHREGMHDAACMEYRDQHARFRTELLGGLLLYGDPVLLSNEQAEWGVSGEVMALDTDAGGDQVLRLSEPVAFVEGKNHLLMLNTEYGRTQGPYAVTAGPDEYHVVIAQEDNAQVYTGYDQDRTNFVFGPSDDLGEQFIVRRVTHNGDMEFSVETELDAPEVHDLNAQVDGGLVPAPAGNTPQAQSLGVVRGFQAAWGGTVTSPEVHCSWHTLEGAESFILQVSTDGGNLWRTMLRTQDLFGDFRHTRQAVKLRIAGMADLRGPWLEFDLSVTGRPADVLGLQLAEPFTGSALKVGWQPASDAEKWVVTLSDPNSGHVGRSFESTATSFEYSYLDARVDGLGRHIKVEVWAVDKQGERSANAAVITPKNPQVGALNTLTVDSLFRQAMVAVGTVADPDYAGVRIWVASTPDFVVSDDNMVLEATTDRVFSIGLPDNTPMYIRAAGIDLWGDDELTISPAYAVQSLLITETEIADDSISTPKLKANSVTSTEVAAEAIRALHILAGEIGANHIDVDTLAALAADLGTITAGLLQSADGKVVFDLNNKYLKIEV